MCRTCYSAGKAFRRALLRGSYRLAMEAYGTGCVNLRAPFSDKEVRWLAVATAQAFSVLLASGTRAHDACDARGVIDGVISPSVLLTL